ncbi:MAG: FHA domain-containing protein [Verrucomicrobiae bacterium]|nr:FHA domain-containing protein [Verrucomicrobiae bacterium]NNJ42907.1 FHA domain-containing protein [Akkermansiaceae bacterium]
MPRVTISEPGKTSQPYRFKLERKRIKIGRGSDNDIVIECVSASTNHCSMERVEGGYIMRDKGSTNGIKLDDTPMEVIDLYNGTEVLVGDVPVFFELSDDELEILDEEEFSPQQKKKLPPVDEEEEPKLKRASTSSPRASHTHRPQPALQTNNSPLASVFILILIILAVFAGLTLRHQQRTGEFLPSKLMGDNKQEKQKVKPDDQTEDEESDFTEDPPVTDSEM